MKWTEDQINLLKEKYVEEIPLEVIAKNLNRSRQSIKRKAQNMGLYRKWVRFNKPTSKESKKIIDRRYYEKNKDIVYRRKMDRRKKLKEEAVKLAGGKCSNCGYDRCLSALEFHHSKNNKEDNITSFIKNGSRQKLLKEVEKCILLCANCHRELHSNGSVG